VDDEGRTERSDSESESLDTSGESSSGEEERKPIRLPGADICYTNDILLNKAKRRSPFDGENATDEARPENEGIDTGGSDNGSFDASSDESDASGSFREGDGSEEVGEEPIASEEPPLDEDQEPVVFRCLGRTVKGDHCKRWHLGDGLDWYCQSHKGQKP
jgi:hypothetical protein